jgi:hypothetical protein
LTVISHPSKATTCASSRSNARDRLFSFTVGQTLTAALTSSALNALRYRVSALCTVGPVESLAELGTERARAEQWPDILPRLPAEVGRYTDGDARS